MSTWDLDDRENPASPLYYAPPRHRRFGDEGTIRPVLERLRRGDVRDEAGPGPIRQVLGVEELVLPEDATPVKDPSSFVGRLAIASVIAAGLAIMAVTLVERSGIDYVPTAQPKQVAMELPKKVQTVSFKPDSRIVREPSPSAVARESAPNETPPPAAWQGANVADRSDAVAAQAAEPRAESSVALTSPLKQWAMIPSETLSPAWNLVNKDAKNVAASQSVDSTPAESASAKHYVRHARRHRTTWHHRQRRSAKRAAAAQPPAEQTEQAADVQPVKKIPIQAALDSLLGRQ